MTTYNINEITFNEYGIRNGDMIAIINVIQWLRQKHQTNDIKFYLKPKIIVNKPYIKKFYKYLLSTTDFFSITPGEEMLPYENIMLWDFRDNIGDVVHITNDKPMKQKALVFPLFDADYNTLRNWPLWLYTDILTFVRNKLPDHECIVCAAKVPDEIELEQLGFKLSTDFMDNINHILDCEVFVGGDTGTSHFASSLDRGPKELVYFYSCRSMIHTLPFHLLGGKGTLNTYSTLYNMHLF
jgi:ADP-heptose:LPS heptosyltransferase